jgi:hypothetical protein
MAVVVSLEEVKGAEVTFLTRTLFQLRIQLRIQLRTLQNEHQTFALGLSEF